MDVTGCGFCPLVGFGTNHVGSFGSPIRELLAQNFNSAVCIPKFPFDEVNFLTSYHDDQILSLLIHIQ
jgi:hypothetical protein